MPTTTHQYSDHNQSYVSDAGLEKGRGVCDVDADAGTPLADLVSHIILYPSDICVVPLTRFLFCLKSRRTLTSECCFSFSRSNLNWILRPSLNSIGPEIPFISTCNKNHCALAFMRVLSMLHAWVRQPHSALSATVYPANRNNKQDFVEQADTMLQWVCSNYSHLFPQPRSTDRRNST